MRLKTHLMAGALLAFGGIALSPGEAKAYTGYCQSMPVTWATSADRPAGGVSSTGTGDTPVGDSFTISNAAESYPTIRTQCFDTVYLNNPTYQCTMWNTQAQHAMTAGTRNDLRNGQPATIPVYAGTAFVQPGGYGTQITGIRWTKMGEISCLYSGFGGPSVPPVVITNPPTQVGDGRPMTGRGTSSSGGAMTMGGVGGVLKNVDSTTATGMQ